LEVGRAKAAAAPTAAFAVVFAAPQGQTVDPSEVTVLFNRPLRALDVAETDAPSPVSLRARGDGRVPKGVWRWMGTSALVFVPEEHLPFATEYVVTVPSGTKALSGETLAAAFEVTFTSALPSVEAVSTREDEHHLAPSSQFEARFNQPVDPREVERAVSLDVGGVPPRRIALRASRPAPGNERLVRLVPASPLPLASDLAVTFDASLRGIEGPLSLGKERSFPFGTFGPLHVTQVRCGYKDQTCDAGQTPQVEFSNAVSFSDVRAHLRISPPVPLAWPTTTEGSTRDTSFEVPAKLLPGHSYRITLGAGVRDEYGQTMARDEGGAVQVRDLAPAVAIGLTGTVLEATSGLPTVGVSSVNLASYTLVSGALDEHAVAALIGRDGEERVGAFERLSGLPGLTTQRVTQNVRQNRPSTKQVPLAPLLASRGGRGALVVATEFAGRSGPARQVKIASATDLGITAKMSRFGSLVWVTHLSDGRPVPGATVAVVDGEKTLYEAQADADGLAMIPSAHYAPVGDEGTIDSARIVVARKEGDWTWRAVNDVLPAGAGLDWVDESGRMDPLGMLFTDRGVYRPGEAIKLQAIFRRPEPRGTSTPAKQSVTVQATDAQGETLFDGRTTLDAFGAATVDLPLPVTAHLGDVSIEAKLVGAREGALGATTSVQLAAYKASEFKAAVAATAASWIRGDRASFDIQGDYLFGAPMAGAKVRWTATRTRTAFAPPGADDLVADDEAYSAALPDRSPRAERLQGGDAVLDAHGATTVPLALDFTGPAVPEIVTLEAEVQDVSRQTVAASAGALVHPASFYVALHAPADSLLPKGTPPVASVVALEPSGHRRAGVSVHVTLVRRTWTNVLESGDDAGHWDSRAVDTKVGACDVTTTQSEASCSLAAPPPGYYLVRAEAKDERGRLTASSYALYVVGDGNAGGWRATDDSALELVADKKQYEVGDVARILVKSPVREADALFTVERAGIYRQERVHLVGAMPTLSVPITDDLRPNAYVSVHLVHGRTRAAPAHGADVGAPTFKVGHAQLLVDPESRRLRVALSPAKRDLHPGDNVDAEILVTDRQGKAARAELTLWAVDEGVLMLTAYRTPDPLPLFTAPRPLAVFGLESRADLAHAMLSLSELGIDKGDDGGGGGSSMRADFRATAWFQPGVVTDDDGRARVHFKLPDNLTTLRLMAVAVAQDDRFGSGETQLVTSRPLMLRPALPRFLRAGDSLDAGVIVTTKGLPASRVVVTIATEGLPVGGPATREVQVPAGGSVEVRWPMAAPRVGAAKLTFRASAGSSTDAVEVTKRVDAPTALEATALDGETRDAVAERIGKLEGLRDDVGGLDVRVASTALVGVGDGMEQLIEYPYGCTEQLTSRLVPLVMARDLARDFGIALPKDPDGLADLAISKILANQRGEGGFGWWPDSSDSDPWVTAYALWGLDAAQKAGRPVPAPPLERAATWLHAQINQASEQAQRLSLDAFVLDVLATVGSPDVGAITRLYEARATLPLEARALLAHAAVSAKMAPSLSEELMRDFEAHLRITDGAATVADNVNDGYAPMLDSNARTTALVLRALVRANARHPMAARLARGLLAERDGGKWRTTQEAAWALIALDEYRNAAESEPPNFEAHVSFGGEKALDALFRGRTATVQLAKIEPSKLLAHPNAALAFEVDGRGELFYEARLRYALKELPRDVLDRGFFVRKFVRGITADAIAGALATLPKQTDEQALAGNLVLVDLVVVTPTPREQVVIDDPLPAGLEPVDSSLATSAASLQVPGQAGEDDESSGDPSDAIAAGTGWAFAEYHREMHDDRVLTFIEHMPAGMYHLRYLTRATTLGTFVVPPTKAECMYEPEVFGRSAASHLEIVTP
jgi:alpha-2-macroglobulin